MLKLPELDDRTWAEFVGEARALIPTLQPDWTDHNPSDPGIVLIELFSWLAEMAVFRLNELTDENYWTYLKLIKGSAVDRTPGLEAAIQATVQELRTTYRAITPHDYERLALEQWPLSTQAAGLGWRQEVARVHCLPECDLTGPAGAPAPAHVSLVVMPRRSLLVFDGDDDYAFSATDPFLHLQGDITISGWICPTNVRKGYQPLVTRGGEFTVLLQDDGLISFLQGEGFSGITFPELSAQDGRWTHFAFVRQGSSQTVSGYVNGRLLGTQALPEGSLADSGPIYVSGTPGSMCNFGGTLVDVAVWKKACTDEEIVSSLSHPPLAGSRDLVTALTDPFRPGWTSAQQQPLEDPSLAGPVWAWVPHEQLLNGIHHFLDLRRLVTTRVHVVGPGLVDVTVAATLYVLADANLPAVRTRADAALRQLFSPVHGGRDGRGWPFGRSLFLSDLYAALEGIDGVDFVRAGALTPEDPARVLSEGGKGEGGEGEGGEGGEGEDSGEARPFGVRLAPHELPVVRRVNLKLMEPRRGGWQEVTE